MHQKHESRPKFAPDSSRVVEDSARAFPGSICALCVRSSTFRSASTITLQGDAGPIVLVPISVDLGKNAASREVPW